MAEYVSLDNVFTGDIFPDVNFDTFPQFLQQSDESLLLELPAFTDEILETQPTVTTASLIPHKFHERKQCKLSYLITYSGNILFQMKIFPC